jgi:hypothetical protein
MNSKKILSEVYRIKTLMGINESIPDILDFENIQDTDTCTYYDNQNPPEGVDYWFQEKYKKMNIEEKLKYQKIINDFVKKTFDETKSYFTTTYESGDGYNKLVNNFIISSDKDSKVTNLLDYIKNATYKIYYEVSEIPVNLQSYNTAWAFTQLDKVYINVFNFWDGTVAGKKSMYDTLLHELNHVMQNYMLNNSGSFKPPFPSVYVDYGVKTGNKEIHSNFQSIRKLFNIGVSDTTTDFIDKIKTLVSNKSLYWDLGEIKVVDDKLCFLEKNLDGYVDNVITGKENFMQKFMYTLHVKLNDEDEHIADISYLFSEFYKTATAEQLGITTTNPKLKIVYVDLLSLANLNDEFVDINTNNYLDDIT